MPRFGAVRFGDHFFRTPNRTPGAVRALRPNPEPHRCPVRFRCGSGQIPTPDRTAPRTPNHHPNHHPSRQATHWHALNDGGRIDLHRNKQTDAFLQHVWTVERYQRMVSGFVGVCDGSLFAVLSCSTVNHVSLFCHHSSKRGDSCGVESDCMGPRTSKSQCLSGSRASLMHAIDHISASQ
jgi:hypothetical protein